jgi:hypothetical protein
MSAPNNRAEVSANHFGRVDMLAHTCAITHIMQTGIKAGASESIFQVLVYDKTRVGRQSLVLTVSTTKSPMSFQETLTPADARVLAAGLIAAADHHDAITAREVAVLALARKTDAAVHP